MLRALIAVAISIPLVVKAGDDRPCSFMVGRAMPKPEWFVVSGPAKLSVAKGQIDASFFDSRLNSELSHTLKGTTGQVRSQGSSRSSTAAATLRTMGTDSGDDSLEGSYLYKTYRDGLGPAIFESLVLQNATSFVAVTCFAGRGT